MKKVYAAFLIGLMLVVGHASAQISGVGIIHAVTHGSSSSVVVTLPSYDGVGDVTFIGVYCQTNPPSTIATINTPTGWTLIPSGNPNVGAMFYRVFQPGDPLTVTVTLSGSTTGVTGSAVAYSGVNTAAPIVAVDTWGGAIVNQLTAPAINLKYNGDQLLVLFTTSNGATLSAPTGLTSEGTYSGYLLADTSVSGGATVGPYVIGISQSTSELGSGMSVEIKAATATATSPATPITQVGGLVTQPYVVASSGTNPLLYLNPQVGDDVLFFVSTNQGSTGPATAPTAPTGYSLITGYLNNVTSKYGTIELYSCTFTGSNCGGTFSYYSAASRVSSSTVILRSIGVGGVNPTLGAYSAGEGYPYTTPALSPNGYNQLELAFFAVPDQSGTWTSPSGLNMGMVGVSNAPEIEFGSLAAPSIPTPALTVSNSAGGQAYLLGITAVFGSYTPSQSGLLFGFP